MWPPAKLFILSAVRQQRSHRERTVLLSSAGRSEEACRCRVLTAKKGACWLLQIKDRCQKPNKFRFQAAQLLLLSQPRGRDIRGGVFRVEFELSATHFTKISQLSHKNVASLSCACLCAFPYLPNRSQSPIQPFIINWSFQIRKSSTPTIREQT